MLNKLFLAHFSQKNLFGKLLFTIFVESNKEILEMMNNQEELKARIEEEEKILDFYVRYKKGIIEMSSEREWEKEVDECLDVLSPLYRLLKKRQ